MMTLVMHMFIHTRASYLCGVLFYVIKRQMWSGIRELLQTMPKRAVISCVDFFENYTMKIQNEIQNMH
jgi:hypothetical protein